MSLEKFAQNLCPDLQLAILRNLRNNSLLRNNARIDHLLIGELPSYSCNSEAYTTDGDGQFILTVKAKHVLIPIFEVAENPEIPYNELEKLNKEEVIKKFLEKSKILNTENELFSSLKEYSGKLIMQIKTDLAVLSAVDDEKNLIGFSIFEQIGVAKI
jgi:hypothetical protein